MRVRDATALIVALAGCGDPDPLPPVGQVLLFVDTDAVLPPPEGGPPEPLLAPLPLFDRMTIEVFAPGMDAPCEQCTREFVIDREVFERQRASIGVAPAPGETGYRARIRMYRAESVHESGAPPALTVETTVALPVVGEEGIVAAHVVLSTQNVGTPQGDLAAPVEVTPGAPSGSQVGSWPPAARTTCDGEAQPGEVCVPGGAYWMGETELVGSVLDGDRERLVVVSPFFLDMTELTVGAARDAGLTPTAWSGSYDGDGDADWCTFTLTSGSRDDLAVNCVSWIEARAYCQARGGDLPSEAQWEYAARALGKRRYVWGFDPPRCPEAVWGHGFAPSFALPACPIPNVIGGPLAPGSGTRDRLELPDGALLDLAGNVREWTLDTWNGQHEACWSNVGVHVDPVCAVAGSTGPNTRSVRGDGFFQGALVVSAAGRTYEFVGTAHPWNGVRCARPGR